MMNEFEELENMEKMLSNNFGQDEKEQFQQQLASNQDAEDNAVRNKFFLQKMYAYWEDKKLRRDINLAYKRFEREWKGSARFKLLYFVNSNKSFLYTAAAIAIICSVATFFISKAFYESSDSQLMYKQLRRDMEKMKRSHVLSNTRRLPSDIDFGGTGFVIAEDGYVLTNYHVVKDADSVYLENESGDVFKAEVSAIEPETDMALLRIIDDKFKKIKSLPYTLRKGKADIGEDVFTVGFPKDDIVYDRGYLSSKTGFNGDTVAYQISIASNPGNSGGPLFDSKGNVIGIITAKQGDNATFAVKSSYVVDFLYNVEDISFKKILRRKTQLSGLSRASQVKALKKYIYMVKVYNS